MAKTIATKRFKIHKITVEDETGKVFTVDLDTQTVDPADTDPNSIGNFWFRYGGFMAGGATALIKNGISVD